LIKAEEITSLDGLNSLSAEWGRLWERCPTATPFQLPDWTIPWCKLFLNGNELFSIAVRSEEGRLVAFAPLLIEPSFGEKKQKRLVFIGTGISDYLDIIAEPEIAPESARLIFKRILEARSGWDICRLEELREISPLSRVRDFGSLRHEIAPMSICPVLPLPGEAGSLPEKYSNGLEARLKRANKTLLKRGDVLFESARPGNAGEFLEELFRLHEKWWSQLKHGAGVLSGNEIRAFHREAAGNFASKGILRLYGLRFNGELSAVVYGFASRQRFYSYLGGFDPALKRLSPGSLIIEYALKECIREGIKKFDFLRGGERYKYDWGAVDTVNYRLKLSH